MLKQTFPSRAFSLHFLLGIFCSLDMFILQVNNKSNVYAKMNMPAVVVPWLHILLIPFWGVKQSGVDTQDMYCYC